MSISVIVATYGDDDWQRMAARRAIPSANQQNADEVLVLHQPDGTITTARNTLAQQAKGDWLCFLDADDELSPGYLDAMRAARNGNNRALYTPAVLHTRQNRRAQPFFFDRGISLRQDNWLVVGTLIHRDLFHEVDGFGEYPHGFEDWSLWSKCFRVGAEIVKVPDAIYIYYRNPRSKHKLAWRNKKWQVETHQRVAAELDEWERQH